MKLLHALLLAAVVAGCSSKPSDEASGQPTPRVTQTVTVSPTPTETPTPEVTHYRMLTVVVGQADVTFVVALNGNTVGTLNGDTNGDLTPSVLPGDNSVEVSWTQGHPLKAGQKATLSMERQIPGQDGWTTVFSRVVDSTTKVKEAKGIFANEAVGDNTASGGTTDGSSGGGYNPANVTGGSNVTGAANSTTAGNGTGGGSNTSAPGSNLTTSANSTRNGTNSTTGANLTQPPRPAISPGSSPTGTIPGRGAAGNTSPMTP